MPRRTNLYDVAYQERRDCPNCSSRTLVEFGYGTCPNCSAFLTPEVCEGILKINPDKLKEAKPVTRVQSATFVFDEMEVGLVDNWRVISE